MLLQELFYAILLNIYSAIFQGNGFSIVFWSKHRSMYIMCLVQLRLISFSMETQKRKEKQAKCMQSNDMRILICMISKANPTQYNKKSISTLQIYGESFI